MEVCADFTEKLKVNGPHICMCMYLIASLFGKLEIEWEKLVVQKFGVDLKLLSFTLETLRGAIVIFFWIKTLNFS